jgi:hypothetical protein
MTVVKQLDVHVGCWNCGRLIRPVIIGDTAVVDVDVAGVPSATVRLVATLQLPAGWIGDYYGAICPKCNFDITGRR